MNSLTCQIRYEIRGLSKGSSRAGTVVPVSRSAIPPKEHQIMPKLNRQFIDSEIQSPATGQRFYRDDELPGFAIRVTCNSKSYILEKRVGGANRRITIGKCSEISLDAAKKQAQIMLGEIAKGNDPKTGKRINTLNDITLREVVQKYLEVKPLRAATQKNYRSSIYLHFSDWLDMPITSITKDMVEQRHHDLTISPNRTGNARSWSCQQCPQTIGHAYLISHLTDMAQMTSHCSRRIRFQGYLATDPGTALIPGKA